MIRKGDVDAAIAAYEAILKDQPNSLLAVNNLVSLLLDNRSDKASLERAAELAERLKNSNVPQFQDTFGWAQYKSGNTARGREDPGERCQQVCPISRPFATIWG